MNLPLEAMPAQSPPSTAIIELRMYWRRFTMADLERGGQPQRLNTGPVVNGQQESALFAIPPVLQYRYKEKVFEDGAPKFSWSPWFDVANVLQP